VSTPLTTHGSPPTARGRRRLGEVLVDQRLITQEQLDKALELQQATPAGQQRKKLGAVVIELGFASEREVAEALAEALGLTLVDLGRTMIMPEAVKLLPRAVAERSGVLVIERNGGKVTVATADPTNIVSLDDVKLYTGAVELVVLVATDSQIRDHLARSWSLSEDSKEVHTLFEDLNDRQEQVEDVSVQAVEAAPIVRLVDVVLADAVRARASDVHVEPQAGELRIRYRVDGLLRDVMTVPRGASAATVSRIKIVSGLDIAERRKPQDGRAKLTVDGMTVEARISTLPTLHGEKVVVRLLPRADAVPLLAETGLTLSQLEQVTNALNQTQGLVLITGPTGSGKTNTLYAGINQLSTPDRNVVTLEDPVEVQVEGITQVQVHERSGLTFARGLRSVLRQDPDVVLVGEVRDTETAELALQASMTGHLVLTTLHTNDAVSALTRLVDMGVEPFLVASSLSLVVAQRLVRRPCAACAAPYVPSPRTMDLLGLVERDLADARPTKGRGCADCGGTGYKGRVGIYEVLPVTAQLRQVLLTTPTEAAIGTAARENGMLTLRASALAAANRGETTYEEVLRATHVDTVSGPRCPSCARALADGMVCCPFDGTPVGRHQCSGCQKPLEKEWANCPWCRTAVDGSPVSIPAPRTALPCVLVVDHDPGAYAFMEGSLAESFSIRYASTADEALSLLATLDVAGVLVETGLPDLSGIELVRRLRTVPRTSGLPIMVAGPSSAELADEARRAGADDYLQQPAEAPLLPGRVQAMLTRQVSHQY
jgi:type IV pilus assembly protein PilB